MTTSRTVIAEDVATFEVLVPTAAGYGDGDSKLAPRPDTLDGLTVGLLWNAKANGDVALRLAGELITAQFPTARTNFYAGRISCGEAMLAQVVEECDVVVACTADCGSCTSWMAHDCVQLEKAGVPAVIIGSRGFERNIAASAQAFGVPELRFVLVPSVYNSLTVEEAQAQTSPVVADVIQLLTSTTSSDNPTPGAPTTETLGQYGSGLEGLLAFNEDFMDRDWGDGYPLLPPTPAAVSALIDAAGGDPDALVCILPPGNGMATVGKIAVNAAMAGCRPEELPVVFGALRALSSLKMPMGRIGLMATGAQAPIFMVNGPIARELGINAARCCFGPGQQNRVNIRIGRAIILALKNIGRWYPGVMDMDTLGSPRKFGTLFAENEAETPWEPYHLGQGFSPDDDVISVFMSSGEWDIGIQGFVDPQNLALSLAAKSTGAIQVTYLQNFVVEDPEDGRLLILAPEHAQPLYEGGFSKDGFREFLYQHVREPAANMIEALRKMRQDGRIKPEYEELFELTGAEAASRMLPAMSSPDMWKVVVAGSSRARDLVMPLQCLPVSSRITRF